MIVSKGISIKRLFRWTGHHMVWLCALMALAAWGYEAGVLNIKLPWLPVSVIATAVAFYVGFKNNQAYDRMWEARKIWGAIVNSSRAWGMYADGFVNDEFAKEEVSQAALIDIKKRLIYRHIAWLYTLREQLLEPTSWEHSSQAGHIGRYARLYQEYFGTGMVKNEVMEIHYDELLNKDDLHGIEKASNKATQLINRQSRDLANLKRLGIIDDFRHMEMEKMLYDLYQHQGKCERIKKFPLPRQFANLSRYFVGIFIMLLPFSMIPELLNMGQLGVYLSVPIAALVGWVYVVMEILGDYSENPFQGMANDIPMLSICRTIEIDLREMLEERKLPSAIQAHNDILM
ncbi:MAG: hypothetical protein GC180_13095 [Bacteroidetes bacterium]|nr:hypothetical protein [Bacteroidota bacterium]